MPANRAGVGGWAYCALRPNPGYDARVLDQVGARDAGSKGEETLMSGKLRKARSGSYLRLIPILGLLVAMLALASPAQAQLPSICTEYPDHPSCEVAPDSFDVPPVVGDLGPQGLAGGDNLGNGDGTLPFTGYPVSPLILFAILLLLLGIAARVMAHVSRRFREQGASA